MSLINRSPGMFIVLAALVVYGVIGIEIWMWVSATVFAVAVTLLLIAVTAGLICRGVLRLMDDSAADAPPAIGALPKAVRERPAVAAGRPALARRGGAAAGAPAGGVRA